MICQYRKCQLDKTITHALNGLEEPKRKSILMDDKANSFQSLAIGDNGHASFINDRNSEFWKTHVIKWSNLSARKESKPQLSANPSTNLFWMIKNHILCPLMMLKMKLS